MDRWACNTKEHPNLSRHPSAGSVPLGALVLHCCSLHQGITTSALGSHHQRERNRSGLFMPPCPKKNINMNASRHITRGNLMKFFRNVTFFFLFFVMTSWLFICFFFLRDFLPTFLWFSDLLISSLFLLTFDFTMTFDLFLLTFSNSVRVFFSTPFSERHFFFLTLLWLFDFSSVPFWLIDFLTFLLTFNSTMTFDLFLVTFPK